MSGPKAVNSEKKTKKIWLAIGTPFQVNIFYFLMKRLEDKYEFLVTARDHDKIIPILEKKGIEHIKIGSHGGKSLDGKLKAYAETVQQYVPLIKKERPDLLITERWPEAVRCAFGLGIPAWTIFYDEREYHVNWLTFPLSSKVFVPSFYTLNDLRQHGIHEANKVVWFNGFHTTYLKDFTPSNPNPFTEAGMEHPLVLVRPEPDFATFFNGKNEVLVRVVNGLRKEDRNLVVWPRSMQQAKKFPKEVIVPQDYALFDCPSAYADLTIGAAETMLMESFVCGVPTISAIYWEPSKPVLELHKYIHHYTDPQPIVKQACKYLDDPDERKSFTDKAKSIVDMMDNPVDKIAREVKLLFEPSTPASDMRRSQLEICMDILNLMAMNSTLRVTQVAQAANINYEKFKSVIQLLTRQELIEEDKNHKGKAFTVSSKGFKTLQQYVELKEYLGL